MPQLFSAIVFISLSHYKNSMMFLWTIIETSDCITVILIWPLWNVCHAVLIIWLHFFSHENPVSFCAEWMVFLHFHNLLLGRLFPIQFLSWLNPLLKNSSLIKCLPVNTCFIHEPKDFYVSCPSPSVCQVLQFKVITNVAENM